MTIDFTQLVEQTLAGTTSEPTADAPVVPITMQSDWEYNHYTDGSAVGLFIRFRAAGYTAARERLTEIMHTLTGMYGGRTPSDMLLLQETLGDDVTLKVYFYTEALTPDELDANLYEG